MANTKISALPANTTPSGSEELVYASNNANGKMTLDTMKGYVESNLTGYATTADLATKQDLLVSATNIKTVNGSSILGSGDLIISGGAAYSAGTGIDITSGTISNTGVTSVNGQTGDVTVSGGGGSGGYDCVVAADGTGDYTTIGAAVTAGKINIFVKNGSYTESAGWDVSSSGKLSITGESRGGVSITIPNTATASSGYRFINMGTGVYAYLKNLGFNISLTSSVRYLINETENMGFKVEDCDFTYNSSYNGGILFYLTGIMTGASVDSILTGYKNPQKGVYGCTFYTETGGSTEAYLSRGDMYYERCNFSTGAAAGEIGVYGSSSDTVLNHCYVGAYSIKLNSCSLHFTIVEVTSGTSSSEFEGVFNSRISFSGVTSSGLSANVVENSDISLGTVTASLGGGNSTHSIINSQISAGSITVGGHATNNSFSGPTTFDMGGKNIIGNIFYGNVTLSESNVIFIGNNYDGYTLTDSGTGNVKANNIS